MNNPLVTIIVPCYNQAQYLHEALQSVLNQTYENWECIIVNDGSPDDTEEVARHWVKKDSRFVYLYKDNGGLSSARNLGLEKAQGDYIQFLDSDDYIVETKLELSLATLQYENNNIVITNFNMFTKSINDLQQPFCNLRMEFFNFENLLFGWDYEFNIPIHCGFFQKSFFNNFKFQEALKAKEDWIMWLSFFKNENHVYFINSSLAYYRIHKNSMTKDLKHMETNSAKVLTYLKEIVSEKYFIDYLCFILEKKQIEIANLNLRIINIQNSRGFKLLKKIKEKGVVKFIYKKLK